jgi:hypothetical protein
MLDDKNLDHVANEAINSRKLPSYPPVRQWGGPATGADCPICGERIEGTGLEYELEFRGDKPGATITHHVHVACFLAWERCLADRALAKPSSPPQNHKADSGAKKQLLLLAGGAATMSLGDHSPSSGPKCR